MGALFSIHKTYVRIFHLLEAKMSSTNPLHEIIDDDNHLTSSNFTDWLRNLKILIKSKHIVDVLVVDSFVEPASDAFENKVYEYHK